MDCNTVGYNAANNAFKQCINVSENSQYYHAAAGSGVGEDDDNDDGDDDDDDC